MRIVVLGATGATGKHVLQQALANGHDVVAYIRNASALEPRSNLTITQGELTDIGAMTAAFVNADAVISCIGAKLTFATTRHSDLMQRVLRPVTTAVEQAGVDRFILMSAFGVGDTAKHASGLARFMYRTIVRAIFTDKARSEEWLPRTRLDWTIVYPVMLHEAPAAARVTVIPLSQVTDVPGLPKIPFANVAATLLALAVDKTASNQRLLITA